MPSNCLRAQVSYKHSTPAHLVMDALVEERVRDEVCDFEFKVQE